jgi:hypothetical protein
MFGTRRRQGVSADSAARRAAFGEQAKATLEESSDVIAKRAAPAGPRGVDPRYREAVSSPQPTIVGLLTPPDLRPRPDRALRPPRVGPFAT